MRKTLPWRMNERNFVPATFYAVYSISLTWYLYLNICINGKKPAFQMTPVVFMRDWYLQPHSTPRGKLKFSR